MVLPDTGNSVCAVHFVGFAKLIILAGILSGDKILMIYGLHADFFKPLNNFLNRV